MKTVNMHEAKSQLSSLVRDLREGTEAEIVIALAGAPAARLLPAGPPAGRALGPDRGLMTIGADVAVADPGIAELFEG